MRCVFLLAVMVFSLAASVAADEPAKPKDQSRTLPPPTPVTPLVLPYYLPSSLPHPGSREIWQYYGVDQTGRWRPRVILAPGDSYYLYNGQPFGQTTVQPRLFMPYAID